MSRPDRVASPLSRQAYGIPRPPHPPYPILRSVAPSPDPDETLPLLTQRSPRSATALPMKCLACQGPVRHGTAPVTVERDGYRLSWEAVPAWVCTRCGSTYFEPREVERIKRAVAAVSSLAPQPPHH